MKKIVVAVTGASGSIYAKTLLDGLRLLFPAEVKECALIFSENAKTVWEYEIGDHSYTQYPFSLYDQGDFFASPASGSSNYDAMIICPCSMGTLSRIVHGISDNLITRSADVMLKERKQLIILVREFPFSTLHLENMYRLSQMGAVIFPAAPAFYSKPRSMDELVRTVTDRILDHLHLSVNAFRWGERQL